MKEEDGEQCAILVAMDQEQTEDVIRCIEERGVGYYHELVRVLFYFYLVLVVCFIVI